MISREIDQILLVVKAGHTDKKAFYHTVTNLRNINAPLVGVVMNAVTNKTSYGSYYYYYHQYNNYYGNTEDKGWLIKYEKIMDTIKSTTLWLGINFK